MDITPEWLEARGLRYRVAHDGWTAWIGDSWIEVSLKRNEVVMDTNGGNSHIAIRRETLTTERIEKLFEGLTGEKL